MQLAVGGFQCVQAFAREANLTEHGMEILYLLVPLSVVLVFFIIGGVWWAIHSGQFDDIEKEGERILKD